MARPRKNENNGLPQHLLCRRRKRKNGKLVNYYYYVQADGKEISLKTNDKHIAVLKAAELNLDRTTQSEITTFITVATRYLNSQLDNKAKSTQDNYRWATNRLMSFFGDPPIQLEKIQAKHIKMYLEWRKDTPRAANFEVEMFHRIWSFAREWGYTNLICPTDGVTKYTLESRDVYVEDHIYNKIYELADQDMKDLMDIAYLTGQRPIDVCNIHTSHIFDGILHITQQKTKAKVRINLIGQLAEIITRRMETHSGYLFLHSRGGKLRRTTLSERFRNLRKVALEKYPELADEITEFQFRDLRAKAGTDTALAYTDESAQKQLGHKSVRMTQRYIRKTRTVNPTK